MPSFLVTPTTTKNNSASRQRQSHTPSPCIQNIVTIPIPTSLDTLRDLYPNLAQHRIERLLEIIQRRESTLTPIPQLIEAQSRPSSLPPLVSRPDTPVPWIKEPVHVPHHELQLRNPSLLNFPSWTFPITDSSSGINRSPPSTNLPYPFTRKDLAGIFR